MKDIEVIQKDAFCVIGKPGSTRDGADFLRKLWQEANSHFGEVEHLAKRDEAGNLVGIWGIMTDFSFAFQPWEDDFSKGLYLAGIEAEADAMPPEGWEKWNVPGFVYWKVKAEDSETFRDTLSSIREQGKSLAGAVQDFTDPATGVNFMLFPVARLDS